MAAPLKLLAVLAHPDDESLGLGGTLAKYAAEGIETYLVTATRGERGWKGGKETYPGIKALGDLRTMELQAAAKSLGVRQVYFLDYLDADLDGADPKEATDKIARHIREIQPDVVVTFGPDGSYGHPDHIAISQFTTAAVVQAAFEGDSAPPHRVSKLYYLVETRAVIDTYEAIIGKAKKLVDGVERFVVAWEEWAVTTRIDASDHWRTVLNAVLCHESQLRDPQKLADLPEATHRVIWGQQTFYRAMSLVNGGREVETDLFAGLR
jgi:LmbE family N-acetylglucosaminyl deacetylase